jgi:hypothetical protein
MCLNGVELKWENLKISPIDFFTFFQWRFEMGLYWFNYIDSSMMVDGCVINCFLPGKLESQILIDFWVSIAHLVNHDDKNRLCFHPVHLNRA